MPGSTPEPYDVAVIGAGPAGLAGAVTAAELGLSVALLDSSYGPGGQFYRHPHPATGATRPEVLHHDWAAFAALRDRLAAGPVDRLFGHHVWTVTRGSDTDWTVHALAGEDGADSDDRRPVTVRARAVLLATGAYERQLPFPGWTLPGVVGAGGAQAMLKSGLALPGRRIVVAGSGPLLLAAASSLTAAGARVPEVIEASDYLGYARHPGVLAANPGKLAEAALHGSALLRHRVRLRTRSAVIEAHGTDRVQAVTVTRIDRDWCPVPGTARRVPCDALAVGHGLIPRIETATTLGCATRRTVDGTHALALSPLQETSLRGMWAAGETGGVGGVQLAFAEGALAAFAIFARLTGRGPALPGDHGAVRAPHAPLAPRAPRSPRVLRALRALRHRRDRMRAFAEAMAVAHAPGPGWTEWLRDDTDVCRCEEVPAGRIREAVAEYGARDTRTVKLLTRAGMGWCQGRMCDPAVTCLATAGAVAPAPPPRLPLSTPVPLGTLASLPSPESAPESAPESTSDSTPHSAPHSTEGHAS
ncbi:FAD-dependent oxidoreductase [Streptomyces sp. NPDC059002]|uniref:FAD-dependent oxidoreductase n=1 Tax=Streptomyces sp. NPDC059002 TaxID=3346690 RepID=UPI0036A4A95B